MEGRKMSIFSLVWPMVKLLMYEHYSYKKDMCEQSSLMVLSALDPIVPLTVH